MKHFQSARMLAFAVAASTTAFVSTCTLYGLFLRLADGSAARLSGQVALCTAGATILLMAANSLRGSADGASPPRRPE